MSSVIRDEFSFVGEIVRGLIFTLPALIIYIFLCLPIHIVFSLTTKQPGDHVETWLDERKFTLWLKTLLRDKWGWFGYYVWGYDKDGRAITWYDFLRNPWEVYSEHYMSIRSVIDICLFDLRVLWWKYIKNAPAGSKPTGGKKFCIYCGNYNHKTKNGESVTVWVTKRCLVSFTFPRRQEAKFFNSAVSFQFGVNLGLSWLLIPIILGMIFISYFWFGILLFFPYFSLSVQPTKKGKYLNTYVGWFMDGRTKPQKQSNFGFKFTISSKEAQWQWNKGSIAPARWEGHC